MQYVQDTGSIEPEACAPDMFTANLTQARLARLWRSLNSRQNSKYDPTQGEQRYDRFRTEFLSTLPPALALDPDRSWDRQLPKLVMQRQLLHINIFDFICWIFRPLLLMTPDHVASLAPYKQVLIQAQKKELALAAIKELEVVSDLHSSLGGSHTRFTSIIFSTFEAAVLLLCLCLYHDFSHEEDDFLPGTKSLGFLGLSDGQLTREQVLQAVEIALRRLQLLAEISSPAASGASVLLQLYTKAKAIRIDTLALERTQESSSFPLSWPSDISFQDGGNTGCWASLEQLDPNLMTGFPISQKDIYTNSELVGLELSSLYSFSNNLE